MDAFTNAYEYAIECVMYTLQSLAFDNKEDAELQVYYAAEQALRDWDAFDGARHTNYKPAEYELTDSQWYDCLSALQETALGRLGWV